MNSLCLRLLTWQKTTTKTKAIRRDLVGWQLQIEIHTHTQRSVVRMQYVSANKSNFGYSFDLLHDTHAHSHAHMHAMLYALTCSWQSCILSIRRMALQRKYVFEMSLVIRALLQALNRSKCIPFLFAFESLCLAVNMHWKKVKFINTTVALYGY